MDKKNKILDQKNIKNLICLSVIIITFSFDRISKIPNFKTNTELSMERNRVIYLLKRNFLRSGINLKTEDKTGKVVLLGVVLERELKAVKKVSLFIEKSIT